MNGGRRPRTRATLSILGLAAALMGALPAPAAGQVAIRAETLHTVSGPALENAVVIAGADGAIEVGGSRRPMRIFRLASKCWKRPS